MQNLVYNWENNPSQGIRPCMTLTFVVLNRGSARHQTMLIGIARLLFFLLF
jgi:hypothetical protein